MRFAETADLLSCVHCGLCLSSCPTYLELGTEADSPRGRILLMRALEEDRLVADAEVRRHLDSCLGCRACEAACPSGVPYGSLIEAARPYVESHRPWPGRLARRALGEVLTRRALRRGAEVPLRLLAGTRLATRLARSWRWAAYAAAVPRRVRRKPLPTVLEPEGTARGTALLLTGCVAESMFAETARATAHLLVRAGVRVLVPRGQGCCGALPLHLGAVERAKTLATPLAGAAATSGADWIIPTAAGCGAALRDYHHLLPGNSDAERVARSTRDPMALLAELGLPPPVRPVPRRVAVHDPCHLLHAQGVSSETRDLLGQIPELRIVPLAESDVCCGSAGTYNLTEPELASRLLSRKLDHVVASGAEVLAAANPGCILQIRAGAIARGLLLEVAHPIDLLARAHLPG